MNKPKASGTDGQTAAFLRQLDEAHKMEVSLLAERAHAAAGETDAAQSLLAKRTAAQGARRQLGIRIGMPFGGYSQASPGQINPSNVFSQVTGQTAGIILDSLGMARYTVLFKDDVYHEAKYDPKKAALAAMADPNTWDTMARVVAGYKTRVSVPASQGTTRVSIGGFLSAGFSWVEANAIKADSFACVVARARMWLEYQGQLVQPPPVLLVNFNAADGQVLTHYDMPTTSLTASFIPAIDIAPSNGARIRVYEVMELWASTTCHACIEGGFTWSPLVVDAGLAPYLSCS